MFKCRYTLECAIKLIEFVKAKEDFEVSSPIGDHFGPNLDHLSGGKVTAMEKNWQILSLFGRILGDL